MKNQILTLTFGLSLFTIVLKAQDHHDHGDMNKKGHENHKGMVKSYDAPKSFQQQLQKVYKVSIELNEAFVTSDVEKVKEQAKKVKGTVEEVDMKLVKGDAHMAWMHSLKGFKTNLDKIIAATTIKDQRVVFSSFNNTLYESIKSFGINGEEAYYQFCPMANSNKGAYWLSNSKEIRNPYFGNMMLKCGSVKEEL